MKRILVLFLVLTLITASLWVARSFVKTSPQVSPPSDIASNAPSEKETATTAHPTDAAPSGNAGAYPKADGANKPLDAAKPSTVDLSPRVACNANALTASVAEALKSGQHPERLTPLIAPKPFDRAAFDKDPAGYCAVFEPGRVFQTMKATGPDSVHLRKVTAPAIEVSQGQPVTITVKGAPDAPVTLISADGGYFKESHLNGITVLSDDKGLASATYVADSGTTGNVRVLAGSPLAVGVQNFLVNVSSEKK